MTELVKTEHFEFNAELSPDGRYIAYQSDESGQYQIVVRPFPLVNGGMWTTGSGTNPMWARNGKELFYRDENGLMAVPVDTTGSTFVWSSPRKLFDNAYASGVPGRAFDASPDGRRFLMVKETPNARARDIVVVLDWVQELNRLVPGR